MIGYKCDGNKGRVQCPLNSKCALYIVYQYMNNPNFKELDEIPPMFIKDKCKHFKPRPCQDLTQMPL
jgi:hypothetical protein